MHTLNPFVCGTFHDHDDEPFLASPAGSSPRRYKRKDKNNPYSTRGLDKFSELLADLDEKRQKIYSQMNPHDISFVRFVYSKTNDFVPVVVKLKNNKDQKHKSPELRVLKPRALTLATSESTVQKSSTTIDQLIAEKKKKQPKMEKSDPENGFYFSWHVMRNWDVKKPSFYLPLVIMLILLLLTMFGRSFAIMCTCVMWYVISTSKDNSSSSSSSNLKKSIKKKDYVRGWSEKKMVVTEETKNKKVYARGWSEKKIDPKGLLSPRSGEIHGQHAHKKSWS